MIMASKTARSIFLKRWLLSSAIAVAMATACMMMFGTATLKADCSVPGKHLMGSVFHPAAFVTMAAEEENESHSERDSVVGQWHVLLLINGDPSTPLFQSIVQYHVGGTEMENADIPTTGGNICFGVWKQHGNHVEIYHVALLFDGGGNPTGYAIFRQWNTLDNDGDSYHGHFTYKVYGPDNVEDTSMALSGTTEGHRIDFHHPFTLY
jgi:hypothetical protein